MLDFWIRLMLAAMGASLIDNAINNDRMEFPLQCDPLRIMVSNKKTPSQDHREGVCYKLSSCESSPGSSDHEKDESEHEGYCFHRSFTIQRWLR